MISFDFEYWTSARIRLIFSLKFRYKRCSGCPVGGCYGPAVSWNGEQQWSGVDSRLLIDGTQEQWSGETDPEGAGGPGPHQRQGAQQPAQARREAHQGAVLRVCAGRNHRRDEADRRLLDARSNFANFKMRFACDSVRHVLPFILKLPTRIARITIMRYIWKRTISCFYRRIYIFVNFDSFFPFRRIRVWIFNDFFKPYICM